MGGWHQVRAGGLATYLVVEAHLRLVEPRKTA
jgi:hypothetical protein